MEVSINVTADLHVTFAWYRSIFWVIFTASALCFVFLLMYVSSKRMYHPRSDISAPHPTNWSRTTRHSFFSSSTSTAEEALPYLHIPRCPNSSALECHPIRHPLSFRCHTIYAIQINVSLPQRSRYRLMLLGFWICGNHRWVCSWEDPRQRLQAFEGEADLRTRGPHGDVRSFGGYYQRRELPH